MADERVIAQDKAVACVKKHQGRAVTENAAVALQSGNNAHRIDGTNGPSNSVAHLMVKTDTDAGKVGASRRGQRACARQSPETVTLQMRGYGTWTDD